MLIPSPFPKISPAMAEKRGGRSRSLSLDKKASKRRCLSHSRSRSSIDSYLDDQSWTSRLSEKKFTQVSGWHRSDLEAFGVYYSKKNSSIAEIFSLVEKRCDIKINDLPETTKLLIKSTKDIFKLSLHGFPDFQKKVDIYRGMDLIKECSQEISSHVKDVVKKLSHGDHDDSHDSMIRKLTMYLEWNTKLEDFISELKIIMHKIVNIENIRETDFQWLFMKFSEVFLMKPQPGDIFPREMSIKGKTVTCNTDIRFVCNPSTVLGSTCLIVMITEVKKINEELSEADTDCVISQLSDGVLGQIGGELLFENKYSAFFPGVLGILCCGTKLIFLYCEITKQHLQSIKTCGEPKDHSNIYYTKAFDYMQADDRNEIIDYLFWLGCFQSSQDYDL